MTLSLIGAQATLDTSTLSARTSYADFESSSHGMAAFPFTIGALVLFTYVVPERTWGNGPECAFLCTHFRIVESF